ncbi:DUF6286 domain-containing protein [Corynebacterium pacaense]|uniref:DUF6286 domain-containing protein n=1 Tax=Corynebacterium pacaense TaxID=1816684 RepID=UPI0009B9CDAF|nr:DUF6286 domain-containing protein [Corynebacterium pacaense]
MTGSEDSAVREPRATPLAKWVALLAGVALLAVSCMGARELYILGSDTTALESWVEPVLEIIGNARYQYWMFPLGCASAVLGLVLLYISVRPRTRTHRRISSRVPVYMRPLDLMRMFTAAAEGVPGVATARTVVRTRQITVTVYGDTTDPELSRRVLEAVEPLGTLISPAPTVSVTLGSPRREGGAR